MTIKAVVFDFGGVLIDWDPRYLYRKIFTDESEMEYFLTNICTPEWNASLDKGVPFKQGVAERIEKFPQYADEITAFDTRWEEMRGRVIQENVDLMRRLADKYPVYGLTNWSEEKFAITKPKYEFFDILRGIVISGVEKEIKPDPKLFKILQDRYHLNPAETVFIDDSLPNVITAGNLGFKAVHFKNHDQLLADLRQLGVEVD